MKFLLFICLAFLPIILFSECAAHTDKQQITEAQTGTASNVDGKPASTTALPADLKNIIGEWKLVSTLRDDNGNHIIDGEEEKTAMPNSGYLKINADGTCTFQSVMHGSYTIHQEEGRQRIDFTSDQGDKYSLALYIISVTDQEMVFNVVAAGSGFEVYKRI